MRLPLFLLCLYSFTNKLNKSTFRINFNSILYIYLNL